MGRAESCTSEGSSFHIQSYAAKHRRRFIDIYTVFFALTRRRHLRCKYRALAFRRSGLCDVLQPDSDDQVRGTNQPAEVCAIGPLDCHCHEQHHYPAGRTGIEHKFEELRSSALVQRCHLPPKPPVPIPPLKPSSALVQCCHLTPQPPSPLLKTCPPEVWRIWPRPPTSHRSALRHSKRNCYV